MLELHFCLDLYALQYVKEDLSEQGAEPRIEQNVYGAAVEIIASLDAHESKGSKASVVNGLSSQGSNERGAVLVFLPGLLEIETLYKLLNDFVLEREKYVTLSLPLYYLLTANCCSFCIPLYPF